MSGDDDPAVTEELPPLPAGRVEREPVVFAARARPVVMSAVELDLIDEVDDPSAYRDWLRARNRGDGAGPATAPIGQPDERRPDERRRSLASLVAHGAVVAILALPATFIVALGIALAVR